MAKSKWGKVCDLSSRGKKIGVVLANTDTGVERVLLNPHGKYQKYIAELNQDVRYTNTYEKKVDDKGKPQKLTALQRAYRAGYRSAVIDSTKAYKGGRK